MVELLHKETTGRIIGAAMEVHHVLGPGFLEAVYEEALARELTLRDISFERQKPLTISYKGKEIKEYVCDVLVEGCVVVELKAIKQLTALEEAQILNYLKASNIQVGLLLNFGEMSLKHKRFVV
jgi:GxxExxY protein